MRVASEWIDTEAGREVPVCRGLGAAFTSDGRQDKELDNRIGRASAAVRVLHYSVIMIHELSKKAKVLIFKTVLSPFGILIYGHESSAMNGKSAITSTSVRNEVFTKN